MGRDAEARQALLGLVCANKYRALGETAPWPGRKGKAELYQGCQPCVAKVAPSWPRAGRASARSTSTVPSLSRPSLPTARSCPFRDSPFYDKALHKLAWTFTARIALPRRCGALMTSSSSPIRPASPARRPPHRMPVEPSRRVVAVLRCAPKPFSTWRCRSPSETGMATARPMPERAWRG